MASVQVIGLTALTKAIEREIAEVVDDTAKVFEQEARKKTPIRTGNARRNWKRRNGKDTFEVENRVPYIERLEEGYSKQAPRGITGPTVRAAKRRIR